MCISIQFRLHDNVVCIYWSLGMLCFQLLDVCATTPTFQHLLRTTTVRTLNAQSSCYITFFFYLTPLFLQSYYQNRPTMATSAPRVQTSSGPRPVGPAHVYPPSSQMMMISQQQIPFASSPQGYFIPPGQVCSHQQEH